MSLQLLCLSPPCLARPCNSPSLPCVPRLCNSPPSPASGRWPPQTLPAHKLSVTCSSRVSFESRYGTWLLARLLSSPSAEMTLPRPSSP
eukprot:21995-Chlamydomonas_euryale.AAC.1